MIPIFLHMELLEPRAAGVAASDAQERRSANRQHFLLPGQHSHVLKNQITVQEMQLRANPVSLQTRMSQNAAKPQSSVSN